MRIYILLKITALKPGILIEISDTPYQVVSSSFNMLGRGHAMAKTKLKNLTSGAVTEKVFKGSELIKEAEISRQKANFLYQDKDKYFFMDSKTYEQFSFGVSILGTAKNFLKSEQEVEILYFDDKPISVDLPIKIALKIIEAEPNVRGDRETPGTKKAKTETGASINVPLFIKEGDIIVVDTRDGKYIERAK